MADFQVTCYVWHDTGYHGDCPLIASRRWLVRRTRRRLRMFPATARLCVSAWSVFGLECKVCASEKGANGFFFFLHPRMRLRICRAWVSVLSKVCFPKKKKKSSLPKRFIWTQGGGVGSAAKSWEKALKARWHVQMCRSAVLSVSVSFADRDCAATTSARIAHFTSLNRSRLT